MKASALTACEQELRQLLQQSIPPEHPLLVGILNMSPESIDAEDHSAYHDIAEAQQRVLKLIANGSAIVDIGGESTAPGRKQMTAENELARISEIVSFAAERTCVSIDTYKAEVARECLQRGARIINDVSGLRADPEMAAVVKKFNSFVVIMYSKSPSTSPQADSKEIGYANLCRTILEFLAERIEYALSAGIPAERIIIDPGMGGFISPDPEYSWQLLAELEKLTNALSDYPMLIGTSRKGFLGGPGQQSDCLSQLTALAAYNKGARLIRTHNPGMARDFVVSAQRMCSSI